MKLKITKMTDNNSRNNLTDVFNFMLDSGNIISCLAKLLDMKFVGNVKYIHPVAASIRKYFECQNTKDFQTQKLERIKLVLLCNQLQEIQKYDNELLLKFRKKLKNIRSNEYFGERLEIQIAYNLITKKIKFKKDETPDFTIYNSENLFVECTSTHLTHTIPEEKDPKYKIKFAITKKSRKPYNNTKTALFIDITNLVFHDKKEKFLADKIMIKKYVTKYLSKTNFGSIILFSYMIDWEKQKYGHRHIRLDSDSIPASLQLLLDKIYPFGEEYVSDYTIPEQG